MLIFKVHKRSRELGDNPFRDCPMTLSNHRPRRISASHETVSIRLGSIMMPCPRPLTAGLGNIVLILLHFKGTFSIP